MSDEEEEDLHYTHDWASERFVDADGLRYIPACLDCRVNGFVDEPKAFLPCPGPKVQRSRCRITMWSLDDPGHEHRCLGGHTAGYYHFCKECKRWYGVKE